MKEREKKKYGLDLAICMVIGIVIGSGVFFKSEQVLTRTEGNITAGIIAWVLGGTVMLLCAYCFSVLATRYEKVSGIVDYSEALMGEDYGFFTGWFLIFFYYPTLAAVLSYVSAKYLSIIFGKDITDISCLGLAFVILLCIFSVNILSPRLSGKIQISSTVIKLIPLVLMAVFGSVKGITSGTLRENLISDFTGAGLSPKGFLNTLTATAFAYEGWIIATTINSELRDAKKTLPKALIAGSISVTVIYIAYYIGLTSSVNKQELISKGEAGIVHAFTQVFSDKAGVLLFVFVVISCIGALNGLMMGSARGMYSLAVRNKGIKPELFSQTDKKTGIPLPSAFLSLAVSSAWLIYYYGSQVRLSAGLPSWFGSFNFDISELPVVTAYGMYIPVFISMIKKEKGLSFFKGRLIPLLASAGCLFMVFSAFYAHAYIPVTSGEGGIPMLSYIIVLTAVMAVGSLVR